MRMSTESCAKFESIGRPQFTQEVEGTTREIVMQLAQWMKVVHMGSHIRITVARSKIELEAATRKQNGGLDDNMLNELESMLSDELDLSDDPEPELIPRD